MAADMSRHAVTGRLRRASQLRDLCLRLGKASRPAGALDEGETASDESAGRETRRVAESREEYRSG